MKEQKRTCTAIVLTLNSKILLHTGVIKDSIPLLAPGKVTDLENVKITEA